MCDCVCISVYECCRRVFGLGFGSGYSGATYIVRPARSLTNIIPFFAVFLLFSFCSFSLLLLCCFAFFASPPQKAQTHFCLLRYVVAPTEPNRRRPIIINNNFRQLGPSSTRERRRRRRTYGRVGSGRFREAFVESLLD